MCSSPTSFDLSALFLRFSFSFLNALSDVDILRSTTKCAAARFSWGNFFSEMKDEGRPVPSNYRSFEFNEIGPRRKLLAELAGFWWKLHLKVVGRYRVKSVSFFFLFFLSKHSPTVRKCTWSNLHQTRCHICTKVTQSVHIGKIFLLFKLNFAGNRHQPNVNPFLSDEESSALL